VALGKLVVGRCNGSIGEKLHLLLALIEVEGPAHHGLVVGLEVVGILLPVVKDLVFGHGVETVAVGVILGAVFSVRAGAFRSVDEVDIALINLVIAALICSKVTSRHHHASTLRDTLEASEL